MGTVYKTKTLQNWVDFTIPYQEPMGVWTLTKWMMLQISYSLLPED